MKEHPLERVEIGSSHPSFLFLFLHGFAMHKRPYEEEVRTLLGSTGRAILYDLPGHGEARVDFTRRNIRGFVESAARDVASRRKVPVVVAGESLGCTFLAPLGRGLERHGTPLSGYILFAPPLILRLGALLRWGFQDIWESRGDRPTLQFSLARPLRDCVGDTRKVDELLSDVCIRRWFGLRYLWQSAQAISKLPAGLRTMTAPTLLILGDADPLVARSALPGSLALCDARDRTARLVEGARHSLFWDRHTGAVLTDVRAWMMRHVSAQLREEEVSSGGRAAT